MLNIGPGELLAICVLALIVLGPEKLPQTLRTVGRVTGELRRMSSGFQNEMRSAMYFEDEEDTLEGRRRAAERRAADRREGGFKPIDSPAEGSAVEPAAGKAGPEGDRPEGPADPDKPETDGEAP